MAEIGRLIGQKKISETADCYMHVLTDGREADMPALGRGVEGVLGLSAMGRVVLQVARYL